MALTGAERQRRHRLKLKAQGLPTQARKVPVKNAPEKLTEKRRKATERQQRRRQRIRAQKESLPSIHADTAVLEETFVAFKQEPETFLESNGIFEHQADAGNCFKRERVMHLKSSERVVEEAIDAVVEFESGSYGCTETSYCDQNYRKQFEESSADVLAQQQCQKKHGETNNFGTGSSNAGDVISCGNQSTDEQQFEEAALDDLVIQQRLEQRRQRGAERQRKYRSRLKAEGKYENYKLRHTAVSGRSRSKQAELEKSLPDEVRKELAARRREDTRLRVARCRERKKTLASLGIENPELVNSEGPVNIVSVQQPQLVSRNQYIALRHVAPRPQTPVVEVHATDDADSPSNPSCAPFTQGLVPYTLQTLKSHTGTMTGALALNDSAHHEPISSHSNDKNWSEHQQREEKEIESDASAAVYHTAHHYITPPIWPSTISNQNRQLPLHVTAVQCNNDSERPGTSRVHQEVTPLENCEVSASAVQKANKDASHVQALSSQTGGSQRDTDRCGSDNSVRIELVTEFDQDHPYIFNHIPYPLDRADMSQDLRKELFTLQAQSPLVCNYIKKLQSEVHNLREENKQLRKQALCLNETKSNSTMFQFWTGFPNYEKFKALFDILKPKIGPVTCPHPTITPTLEEEFFYVLVRLRVGLFVKDIASRIGVSEADYALIFHRWITALLQELPNVFRVCDETDGNMQTQTSSLITSLPGDYTKVLVDCSSMLSEEAVQKWKNTHLPFVDRCKFVMGVSLTTGSVLLISDISPDDRDNQCMVTVRLSHLHSTVIGIPRSQGDQDIHSEGPVQANSKPLVRVVNQIRSFHILDNYQVKLQCEMFRAVFKVCALLSNVMK